MILPLDMNIESIWYFCRSFVLLSSFRMRHNGLRLGEGGDFQHSLSYEALKFIYLTILSYEALNRHFCQTAVSGCLFVRHYVSSLIFYFLFFVIVVLLGL
jgi:hypothetical protein